MNKKTCFKCNLEKERTEFYKHSQMGDGLLGKCKCCTKKDVQERYNSPEGRAKILVYEISRFQKPERKEKLKKYQEKSRKENPNKWRARGKVSKAVKSGKIQKLPCQCCGSIENIEAHHNDYSKPLDVIWSCFKCHREQFHGQKVGL